MERRNFLKAVGGAASFATVGSVDEALREQDDLPTHEEMVEAHDISENKLVLALEGEGWRAICSPDINSSKIDRQEAPFQFVVSGDPPESSELDEMFAEKFDSKVDEVYEILKESDDPFQAIMDMEPNKLTEGS
jgi:hypothetical protein